MSHGRSHLMPLLALSFLAATSVIAAGDDGELLHNPFMHPRLETSPQRGVSNDTQGRWRPDLRATLVSASNPLVNVGGKLLAVGQEVDGYRLKRIEEGQATFEKDGQEVTVLVRADQGEKDD